MTDAPILVVDDNRDNRKLARMLLEREGLHVVVAEDADQALAAIDYQVPALILMDVQLPGMDGLTLTRMLRRIGALDPVNIVAFSAAAFKADADLAGSAGCDGYITKPVDTRTFAAAVRNYLETPREMCTAQGAL